MLLRVYPLKGTLHVKTQGSNSAFSQNVGILRSLYTLSIEHPEKICALTFLSEEKSPPDYKKYPAGRNYLQGIIILSNNSA